MKGENTMKLIRSELTKHLRGKILWLVLALLLLLNVIFSIREGAKRYDPEELEIQKLAERLVKENPEEMWQNYQTMLTVAMAHEEVLDEWLEKLMSGEFQGEDSPPQPEAPVFPTTYHKELDDYEVLSAYYENALTEEQYQAIVNEKREIARETLTNYRKAGYSEDSYAFRYQVDFWIVYGDALESVHPDDSISYGWDLYWQYDGTGLFLLLAAIFVGARLFTIERESGMDLVLRTCKKGRVRLALSKVSAAAVGMLALSIVFHLSALLSAVYQCGLSSPLAPIQQTAMMVYCPYPLSQLGAFCLTVLFSAIAALAVCLLTAGLTLLIRRALPAIAIMALLVGGEFFLMEKGGEFLSAINLLTATSGLSLFERWLPIHMGDAPVSILPILIVTLMAVALIAVLICVTWWVRKGMGIRGGRIVLPNLQAKFRIPKWMPRLRSVRLFPYEWAKTASLRMTLICLLLVALQIGISQATLDGTPTFYDEMKARYMEEYAHLSLVDAEAAVSERLAIYAEVAAPNKASEMARLRVAGKITYEEYVAFCDLLNEALTHKETLTAYQQELVYLIEKGEELSIETYPVLATGMANWMDRLFDLPAVLLLFVLLAGIFAREYESKFYPLMQTTVRGRSSVWHTKICFALVCSLTVAIGALVLDLVLLLTRYPTDYLAAPLVCISRYQNTASAITAGEYLMTVCLLHVLGVLVWGLFITALSQLLRSEWITAGCLLLLFLPLGLTMLGVEDAKWVDFTMLLSGDRLWLLSTEQGGLTFLVSFAFALLTIALGLVTASYRKFCK